MTSTATSLTQAHLLHVLAQTLITRPRKPRNLDLWHGFPLQTQITSTACIDIHLIHLITPKQSATLSQHSLHFHSTFPSPLIHPKSSPATRRSATATRSRSPRA